MRAQLTSWSLGNLAARKDPEGLRPFLEQIVVACVQLVKRYGCANDCPTTMPVRLTKEEIARMQGGMSEPLWLLDVPSLHRTGAVSTDFLSQPT